MVPHRCLLLVSSLLQRKNYLKPIQREAANVNIRRNQNRRFYDRSGCRRSNDTGLVCNKQCRGNKWQEQINYRTVKSGEEEKTGGNPKYNKERTAMRVWLQAQLR